MNNKTFCFLIFIHGELHKEKKTPYTFIVTDKSTQFPMPFLLPNPLNMTLKSFHLKYKFHRAPQTTDKTKQIWKPHSAFNLGGSSLRKHKHC